MKHLRLLRYLLPHLGDLAVILVTLVLIIAVEVLQPWPIKLLVDQVLGQQPMPHMLESLLGYLPGASGTQGLLIVICASTVVIFLSGTLLSLVQHTISIKLGQRMVYDLGADLFLHLQKLSSRFHNRRPVGDMIARVTGDAYCVQMLVIDALLPLLHSLGMLVAMFVIMWQLDPMMTLLSMSVAPFLVLSIKIFAKPMRERSRERRDLEGRMSSVVHQALTAIPAVQAFSREELEHARFQRVATETVVAYQRSISADMWFKLFVGLVTAVGTAAIMWLGATHALDGKMTIGTILIFIAYLASLYGPLNSITYTASTLQSAWAGADRVMEVLNNLPDVRDLPDAREVVIKGHVVYEHVTFGYEPERPVLKGISFEAKPGEVIAVVGPTGAGKTSLVNLLVRFLDPWSGRVLVDGHDLRHIRIRCLRQQVAIVLQEPFIFPLSVADNIAYGRPGASRDEIIGAALAARADDFIRELPDGYDTVVGERGATLSGGEKQRLSIARAFLKDAPILILDEPTSALDARMESMLLNTLEELTRGRTTFIIAHRLSTIRRADRIVVIDQGIVTEQGGHAELLAQDGLYASLYRQQMNLARHDALPVPAVVTAQPYGP